MQSKYPKILLLAGWYPNSLNTADGNFILHQARLMKENGINISVFHSNPSFRYVLNGSIWKKTIDHKKNDLLEYIVEKPFLPRNSGLTMKLWALSVLRDFENFIQKYSLPDLIHAHSYLGGFIAARLKVKFKIPYLLTLHETSIAKNVVPTYHKDIANVAIHDANEVVAVSRFLGSAIWNNYSCQATIIPNFIDFSLFKPSKQKQKKFTFICIGDLIERKNISLVIMAFARTQSSIPNSQLIIVGDGPKLNYLKRTTRAEKVEQKVIFLGRQNQTQVALELKKAHCLVSASYTETFGIVLIEALACGIPVISTPSGGPSDIVNFSNGILLSSFQLVDLAQAMVWVGRNFSNYSDDQIRKFAYSQFSSQKVCVKYENNYLNILKNETN